MIEALPVIAFLLLLMTSILLSFYLIFAHAWIRFQAEQTLYCMAEGKPAVLCRMQTGRRLTRFLPWGRVENFSAGGFESRWTVEILWRRKPFRVRVARTLDLQSIVKNRALSW